MYANSTQSTSWCTSPSCPGGCAVLGCDFSDCVSGSCNCHCSCGFILLEYEDPTTGETVVVIDTYTFFRNCPQS